MVKTLSLTFDDGQYRKLYKAYELHDATSWEKFFFAIAEDWAEMQETGE